MKDQIHLSRTFKIGTGILIGIGLVAFIAGFITDPDRTWAEIGRYLLHDATTYASWQPANHRSAVHSDASTVEALRAEGKYRVLTPDECVAYAKAQGAFASITLFPLCGGTPPDLAWPVLLGRGPSDRTRPRAGRRGRRFSRRATRRVQS